MVVGTWQDLDFETDIWADWRTYIDNDMAVAKRFANHFAVHEQASPNMTVRVEAGAIFDFSGTLTEVAAQSSGTITAPVTNPRIDRVVLNPSTGAVAIVTGSEGASPSAPTITADRIPLAQIYLTVGKTTILNSDITDERIYIPFNNFRVPGTLRVQGIATFMAGVNLDAQTASRLASFDASKNLIALSTATYPDLTETSYLKGVTSAIQTQLNTKITSSSTDTLTNKTIDGSQLVNGSVSEAKLASPAAYKFISKQSASSSAQIDVTLSGYEHYKLILNKIKPANNGEQMKAFVTTNAFSSVETTNYKEISGDYINSTFNNTNSGTSSSTSIHLPNGNFTAGNGTGEYFSIEVDIFMRGTGYPQLVWKGTGYKSDDYYAFLFGAAMWFSGTAINGIRFKFDTGNISEGDFILYGIKNS